MSTGPEEPSNEELERRMQPGVFSRSGFLGPDDRLADVLERDGRTLAEAGLTAELLADRLDRLLVAAENARSRRARVEGRWAVSIELYTGFQICPWAPDPHHSQCTAAGGVTHGSVDWQLRNLETGEELRGPGLIVHLMRAHGFFEGPGSPARVDPLALARVLGLPGPA